MKHTAIALLILFAACSKNPDNPQPPGTPPPAQTDERVCFSCYFQVDTTIRSTDNNGNPKTNWGIVEVKFEVERPSYHSDIREICYNKLQADYPQYYQYRYDSVNLYGIQWHKGIQHEVEMPCDYKSMKKWMELVDKYEG